jgi:hypothetical protein
MLLLKEIVGVVNQVEFIHDLNFCLQILNLFQMYIISVSFHMDIYQNYRYLALDLNIQILYNTYQTCTTSCHTPVRKTVYRIISIISTFTTLLHGTVLV